MLRSGVISVNKREKDEAVPIWKKSNLTLEEAAAYTGVGVGKLRELSDDDGCDFVLWVGTKRLLKRRKLDEYLDKAYYMKQQRCDSLNCTFAVKLKKMYIDGTTRNRSVLSKWERKLKSLYGKGSRLR